MDDPEVGKSLADDKQFRDADPNMMAYSDRATGANGDTRASNASNVGDIVGGSLNALSNAIPSAPTGPYVGTAVTLAKIGAKASGDDSANQLVNSGTGMLNPGAAGLNAIGGFFEGDQASANQAQLADGSAIINGNTQGDNAHDNAVNAIADYYRDPNGYSAKAGGGWTPPKVTGGYKSNAFDPFNQNSDPNYGSEQRDDSVPRGSIAALRQLSGGS